MNYTVRLRIQAARRGQTLVEYALVLALISVVAVGIMINLGKQVSGVYSTIDSVVASAQASH
jgi:Flp pilus assembly pilin Flp